MRWRVVPSAWFQSLAYEGATQDESVPPCYCSGFCGHTVRPRQSHGTFGLRKCRHEAASLGSPLRQVRRGRVLCPGKGGYRWSKFICRVHEPDVGISASLPPPVLVLRAALKVPRAPRRAYDPEGTKPCSNDRRSGGD